MCALWRLFINMRKKGGHGFGGTRLAAGFLGGWDADLERTSLRVERSTVLLHKLHQYRDLTALKRTDRHQNLDSVRSDVDRYVSGAIGRGGQVDFPCRCDLSGLVSVCVTSDSVFAKCPRVGCVRPA